MISIRYASRLCASPVLAPVPAHALPAQQAAAAARPVGPKAGVGVALWGPTTLQALDF